VKNPVPPTLIPLPLLLTTIVVRDDAKRVIGGNSGSVTRDEVVADEAARLTPTDLQPAAR
jgi:hypothetical protein